ncbi:hypothetical protein [Streptomyces alanosinicus]|uniref:hypothetical protein n=1 Tax=Streptomyces alanosinicus TaxID=68171 RepID=UPI0027E53228|nr:hypothetical protein [Streptomyces alanosinicus]
MWSHRARRGAAWRDLTDLGSTGGRWRSITDLPYVSDDPRYRDIDSNSSGGSGDVTCRVSAIAAADDGYVYAGSAGGGVWRSHTGGGHGQPISDGLPAQSTGALALDGASRLRLGTGEATTNSDACLGSGVHVLTHPHHGTFSVRSRVGGDELESTTIHELRVGGGQGGPRRRPARRRRLRRLLHQGERRNTSTSPSRSPRTARSTTAVGAPTRARPPRAPSPRPTTSPARPASSPRSPPT